MWIDMFPKDLPQPSIAIDITPRKPVASVYLLFSSLVECRQLRIQDISDVGANTMGLRQRNIFAIFALITAQN